MTMRLTRTTKTRSAHRPAVARAAERGARHGPGGFGYELVALEVHDQLVLEALLRLQVLLWYVGGVRVRRVDDGRGLSS